MKRLTFYQLKKACDENDFILVRDYKNDLLGFNTKIAKIILKHKSYKNSHKTRFISFIPCDFQTYINYKIPFL